MKIPVKLERFFLIIGVALLAIFVLGRLHSRIGSQIAVENFKAAKHNVDSGSLYGTSEVDFGLWSEKRVKAYRETLLQTTDTPVGLLRVPRLNIEAPVLSGTDEFALNRGLGWISGTARPGEEGNSGIAGHRDGFFRGLKDVQIGDAVEITTLTGTSRYQVDEIEIVTPQQTAVLGPRQRASVTLVTCYPFYFVGDAPKRFIVHASVVDSNPSASRTRPELAR